MCFGRRYCEYTTVGQAATDKCGPKGKYKAKTQRIDAQVNAQ